MESKLNTEKTTLKEQDCIEMKAQEDKVFIRKNSFRSERSANSKVYQRKFLHHILDENNYILALDENGLPEIQIDQVFLMPNNSNLIVKIINGSKISKNCCMVTNIKLRGISKQQIYDSENDLNKTTNLDLLSTGENNKTIEKVEENDCAKEQEDKLSSLSPIKYQNYLLEKNIYKNYYDCKSEKVSQNKHLSIHELKEISKIYNLKYKIFPDSSSKTDSKVNIHKTIDPMRIKEFENHLVYPISYDTDIYFIIPCQKPGPLSFFVLYENSDVADTTGKFDESSANITLDSSSESLDDESTMSPFYRNINLHTSEITVLIEPKIKIGNKEVNIESLSMQTILSKSLGKLNNWENYFKEANLLDYNIIHFTPIQSIGVSDSLYCLKDQTEINDAFFDTKFSKEEKHKLLHEKISSLKSKYKISCLVDIVLNHTAIYSEWLLKNPEAGYNLENCPYLTVSYELDKLILDFSHRFSEKKVRSKSAPFINNENDLNDLISELSNEIYKKNFEEYFLISIEKIIEDFINFFKSYKKNFEDYLRKKKYLANKLLEKKLNFCNETHIYQLILESADNYGAERYGVKINTEFISILLIKDGFSENQFLAEVKKYLNRLNDDWRNKAMEFIKQAIENTKASIRYEFIQLKRFKVTDKKRLVENYFTTFEPNNKKAIFACNGWLFGVNDPTINFAKYGFWNYFNRSIVIWGDCVKLNYGEKPEDSPYLWQHMTEYVIGMAKVFDGFRLDNSHSTPIFLAEYLMKKAREVNPNLVLIAELFAGTKEREIEFVKRIGINLLIREIIYCGNSEELCDHLYKFGGGSEKLLGKLDDSFTLLLDSQKILNYKRLSGRKPKSIIYDVTHDNPTFFEKYSDLGLNLTFMCCNSMVGSSIGSTRGFDQLFPYQPSVVKESRLYSYDDSFNDLIINHKEILDNEREEINFVDTKKGTEIDFKNKLKVKGEEKTSSISVFEFVPKSSGINHVPSKICLAISSNGWRPDYFLEKVNNDLWRIELPLADGAYEYKYVIDGNNWIFDKTKPTIKDKSNNINNHLLVGIRALNSMNVNFTGNQALQVIDHDFYLKTKDLKIIRREMNFLRRTIAEKSDYDLSEFFIWRDKDIIFTYRGLKFNKKDLNKKNLDFNGYAMICRTGFERNPNNVISSKIELPGLISELVFFSNISVPNFDFDKIRTNNILIGVDSNVFFSKNIKNLCEISKINRL